MSVFHKKGGYIADPEVDDVISIGDKTFTVTAIGEEARYTLKELGHCTLCFKGDREPERPGCIMLEGDEPLLTTDIQKGAVIEIY